MKIERFELARVVLEWLECRHSLSFEVEIRDGPSNS